jgi:hypothetical protein
MPAPGSAGDAKQADAAASAENLFGGRTDFQFAQGRASDGLQIRPTTPHVETRRGTRLRALVDSLVRRRLVLVAGFVLLALVAGGFALANPQLQAWYHFREAKSALQSYHNPQAVRQLQACLRVGPDDPDVLLLSARAARRARAYDEAERCLERYGQARGLDEACSLEQLLLSAERGVDQVDAVCWREARASRAGRVPPRPDRFDVNRSVRVDARAPRYSAPLLRV